MSTLTTVSVVLVSVTSDLTFGVCGIVKVDQQGMPIEMNAPKMGKATSKQIDSIVIALKWMDKRVVMMLSTIHNDSFVILERPSWAEPDGQEDILRPLLVEEYNNNMGA